MGDTYNQFSGSLTGTLIAGHDYSFAYNAFIQAYPTASTTSATVTGFVSLGFLPVPEPDTALLVSVGLIALGLRGSAHEGPRARVRSARHAPRSG